VRRRVLAGIGLALLLAAATPVAAQQAGPTEPYVVLTANGPLTLQLEFADTPEERSVGLMYRKSLAAGTGMLFDFGVTRPVAMWMKNTYVPLDMLFVDADGVVVAIRARTTPLSEDTVSADRPVRGVIELNAGDAAALGIAEGDRVVRPLFATPG
jgi:uncharacterized membrane protein (UPF0127 family)